MWARVPLNFRCKMSKHSSWQIVRRREAAPTIGFIFFHYVCELSEGSYVWSLLSWNRKAGRWDRGSETFSQSGLVMRIFNSLRQHLLGSIFLLHCELGWLSKYILYDACTFIDRSWLVTYKAIFLKFFHESVQFCLPYDLTFAISSSFVCWSIFIY